MQREVKISKYDGDGVFGVVIETESQAPILLETEGDQSSIGCAEDRIKKAFGVRPLRWCIVRLVPVIGNELLLLDMQRLQPKDEEA